MTKKEYANYQTAVEAFFNHQGINCLNPDQSESFFTCRPCECCGTNLGGDRYNAVGYMPESNEVVSFEVCPDCLYYAEYGELDDMTMMDMEKEEVAK